jgi:hypothetical protein
VTKGVQVTLVGRHPAKMELVSGVAARVLSDADTATTLAAAFDTVVEATGECSKAARAYLAAWRCRGPPAHTYNSNVQHSTEFRQFLVMCQTASASPWVAYHHGAPNVSRCHILTRMSVLKGALAGVEASSSHTMSLQHDGPNSATTRHRCGWGLASGWLCHHGSTHAVGARGNVLRPGIGL